MDSLRRMTACLLLAVLMVPGSVSAAELPKAGAVLPAFPISAPPAAEDLQYLGVSGPAFQIRDVDCRILLVEIVGAYCPRCHEQAPLLNTVYKRLERAKLAGGIKMLAIAAGATQAEVDLVRQQWGHKFPVVPDLSFSVHKMLGEPRTPFTLVTDRQGQVLFVHAGVAKDTDAFYQSVRNLLDK